VIGKTLAHYKIVETIGAGGMGEVYRARDTKLDRDIAIKVLPEDAVRDPDRRRRFQAEARRTRGDSRGLGISKGAKRLAVQPFPANDLPRSPCQGSNPAPATN
jgi:serine/threonine protein kinase